MSKLYWATQLQQTTCHLTENTQEATKIHEQAFLSSQESTGHLSSFPEFSDQNKPG